MSGQDIDFTNEPDLTDPAVFNDEWAKAKAQDQETLEDEDIEDDLDLEDGDDLEEDNDLDAEDDDESEDDDSDEDDDDSEDEDDETDGKKSHMVPIGRLNKEVKKNARLEAENTQIKNAFDELVNLLKQANAAGNTKATDDDEDADDDDILDEALERRMDKRFKALEKKMSDSESKATEKEQRQFADMVTDRIKTHREAFIEKQPDYPDAFNHLRKVKIKEFMRTVDNKDEAVKLTNTFLAKTAAVAETRQKDSAQLLYEMAMDYGFKGRRPGPDLKKIGKNKKQSSDAVTGQEVSVSTADVRSYLKDDNFSKLTGKNGRVDPEKFNQIIKKANRAMKRRVA